MSDTKHIHPADVLVHTGRATLDLQKLTDGALARGDRDGAKAWQVAHAAVRAVEQVCHDARSAQTWKRESPIAATWLDLPHLIVQVVNLRIHHTPLYEELDELDRRWPTRTGMPLPNPAKWNRLSRDDREVTAALIRADANRCKSFVEARAAKVELDVFEGSG